MSKQLAISVTYSVLAMAAFALFATQEGGMSRIGDAAMQPFTHASAIERPFSLLPALER